MRNDNDAIRAENKEAMPRFILIMVVSLAIGIGLGLGLVKLSLEDFGDTLNAVGLFFTGRIAPVLLYALPVAELTVCLPIYFGAKKQLESWDGEDESVSSEIESKLSVCIWVTGMATILALLLLGVLISGLVNSVGTPRDVGPMAFFSRLGVFLGTLFVSMILQQKLVDATKKLNPEKHGSVYDTKFHKTWLESCDEAERAVIGQCAYKAYMAMTRACLVLWVVFALGGMFFEWGFLPVLAVCVIWGVGQTVYSYWCLKLAKPGGMM